MNIDRSWWWRLCFPIRFCIDTVSKDFPGLRKSKDGQDKAGNCERQAGTSQTYNEESPCLKTINKDDARQTVVHNTSKGTLRAICLLILDPLFDMLPTPPVQPHSLSVSDIPRKQSSFVISAPFYTARAFGRLLADISVSNKMNFYWTVILLSWMHVNSCQWVWRLAHNCWIWLWILVRAVCIL